MSRKKQSGIVYTEVAAVLNPAMVGSVVSQNGVQVSTTVSAAALSVTFTLLPETQILEKSKKNFGSTSDCAPCFHATHVD